ncbi:MAG TPA: cobalt-zinc-cadmium resistance protein [Noviherbaspirillum sp.]|nr:cobalt-zinc-cadmium resistance protein [Noviherbaspirillum sp.]
MKKLLLIFLLAVLPLQYTWAAAAVYCTHEKSPAAKHFGHHSHKHNAKADDTSKSDKGPVVDNDCGTCHISAQPSFFFTVPMVVPLSGYVYAEQAPPIYHSYIPEGLPRPDWRALV